MSLAGIYRRTVTSLPPSAPDPGGTGDSGTGARGGIRRGPRAWRVAALLVVTEAVGLAGVVVWWLGTAAGGGMQAPSEPFLAAFALAVAVALLAASRSLVRGHRGARAPVITWQLLQAATATTVLGVPQAVGWAVGALVLSGLVIAGLLLPVELTDRPAPGEGPPAG